MEIVFNTTNQEQIRTLRVELREHIIENGTVISDDLGELLFSVYSALLDAEKVKRV